MINYTEKDVYGLARRIRTQVNLYRSLTGDSGYGAACEAGKVRLVHVRYDANGKSTVQPQSPFLTPAAWFEFMLEQSR